MLDLFSSLCLVFLMSLVGSTHCLFMCVPISMNLPRLRLYHLGRLMSYFAVASVIFFLSKEILDSYFLKISVGFLFLGFFMKTLYQSQKCCKIKGLSQNAFLLGILNGFLPCGWLYMSLYILSQSQLSQEVYFLSVLIFWLGTLPIFGVLKFKTMLLKHLPYLNRQSFKFIICVVFGLTAFVSHYKEPGLHVVKAQQFMCLSK